MLASTLLPVLSLVLASATPVKRNPYWQDDDTPVAALFQKRYVPSPSDSNFTSNYPGTSASPGASTLPQAWIDKLATVTLPSFGPSTQNNGYPKYDGLDGAGATVCSFTYECTTADDLLNPPNGVFALSFDDGPTTASASLYSYLAENGISGDATHFMIGGNILYDPLDMQAAVAAGGHIAVHTWTHPYMTTLSNEEVLGELGWTMQIISDLNGGRLPAFWRPPYGDVDNRVRAIAKGVFGLETVVWNQDTGDWAIGNDPAYTLASVEATMSGWLTGSKTPGLVVLEHELNANTVQVFMNEYPVMKSNGWNVMNVAKAFSLPLYQNSDSNTAAVTAMSVGSGASDSPISTFSFSTTMANSSTSMMSSSSSSSSSSDSLTSSSLIITSSISSSSPTTTTSPSTVSDSATTSAAAATASTEKLSSDATGFAPVTKSAIFVVGLTLFALL
ncbi:chitin deacetylase, partial [Tremellales sp. Uapishka_1]